MNIEFKFELMQSVNVKIDNQVSVVCIYARAYRETYADTSRTTLRKQYIYNTSLGEFNEEQLTAI